jgi:hypothetical protein
MPPANGSLDKGGQASDRKRRAPMIHWSDAVVAALIAALVPVVASIGAGYYSAIRQCNLDASNIETQLTSILLELSGREQRIKAIIAADRGDKDQLTTSDGAVYSELRLIEIGADGRSDDPAFKDHSRVNLVDQYNRLIRRVKFPDGFCPADLPAKCADSGLQIDTQNVHAAIATLQFTKAKANNFVQNINDDLQQVSLQQDWHIRYGPERLCSLWTLISTDEPWKLIGLKERERRP